MARKKQSVAGVTPALLDRIDTAHESQCSYCKTAKSDSDKCSLARCISALRGVENLMTDMDGSPMAEQISKAMEEGM